MKEALYRVVALTADHDRTSFHCGCDALDRYFRQQVTQDIRRRITACFVAQANDGRIAGFYTLASSSVVLTDLPAELGKKLPRYPLVPAVRMGSLAVDVSAQKSGLGGALLADALVRTSSAEIAARAMAVDAIDANAVEFYRHHGFIALESQPVTLFLPLATVREL